MGCGGSRADAIEPRYYESWTRETESTWLTNTDAEPPPQQLPGGGPESGNPEVGLRETGKEYYFMNYKQFFTNSSLTGWRVMLENVPDQGCWTKIEFTLLISCLNLRAIYLALISFKEQLICSSVLTRTDNVEAQSYLNKQGG
uniref:Uncharacterized protein n=1 Tax=Sphaerodactylus townsendi TaxID=933632 RepID=A0ACB8FEW6_9SAUR